jgi:hypothetical protein
MGVVWKRWLYLSNNCIYGVGVEVGVVELVIGSVALLVDDGPRRLGLMMARSKSCLDHYSLMGALALWLWLQYDDR